MTNTLFLVLALLAQPPGMTRIEINTRDMVGLRDRENVIRGTCDGRPASATIVMASSGGGGRLVLSAGSLTREVPPTFLNGSLVANGLFHTGLACDGQRLQLSASAIRTGAQGEIIMDVQRIIMDLRTGAISMTEMRTLSPAETRSELR